MVLKPSHWSKDLKEVTLVTARDGVFNFRMVGGSDRGEFPVISEVLPPDTRGVEYTGPQELTTQVSGDILTRKLAFLEYSSLRNALFRISMYLVKGSLKDLLQIDIKTSCIHLKLGLLLTGSLLHLQTLAHSFDNGHNLLIDQLPPAVGEPS